MKTGSCMIHQMTLTISDQEGFLEYIRKLGELHKVKIILFNADRMAGRSHVESAIAHALRAFEAGTAISNSLEMESLLYAAGSRQCQQGTFFGVHPGKNRVYLCICPGNDNVLKEVERGGMICDTEDWETITKEKRTLLMEIFGITTQELCVVGEDRIIDLVLERVALLEVYR